MFIRLWLEIKHSTIKGYFAFVVLLKLTFFNCHNFINVKSFSCHFKWGENSSFLLVAFGSVGSN